MGVLIRNEEVVGGLDSALVNKIGTATLTTAAQNLSGAVNELDAELGNETLPDPSKTVKGNINSIKQSLSDNKIGARVDISDYTTTQNLYVCPCDGFVGVDLTAAANAKCLVRIFGSDSLSNQISIGGWSNGTYGCYTCFVRKGMRLMTALVENNGKPFFIPITSQS